MSLQIMLLQLVLIMAQLHHLTSQATTTQTAKSRTGITNPKSRIAASLISLISIRATLMSDKLLKTGFKIWLLHMVLTVLESIPFQRFQKTFGVNLEQLLEFSKWENASMEILLTSVLIKITSRVFSITQCTTPLKMSSVLVFTWVILNKDTTQAPNITKTHQSLAFS